MDDNQIITLIKKAAQYDALAELLFSTATLSFDKDEIYVDGFNAGVLLRSFEPRRYKLTLDILRTQAEMKIRTDEERMAKEATHGAADAE